MSFNMNDETGQLESEAREHALAIIAGVIPATEKERQQAAAFYGPITLEEIGRYAKYTEVRNEQIKSTAY